MTLHQVQTLHGCVVAEMLRVTEQLSESYPGMYDVAHGVQILSESY
jgi:hypothetical protein